MGFWGPGCFQIWSLIGRLWLWCGCHSSACNMGKVNVHDYLTSMRAFTSLNQTLAETRRMETDIIEQPSNINLTHWFSLEMEKAGLVEAHVYLLLAISRTVPDRVCPSLAKSGVWSKHLTWYQRVRGSVGAVESHTVDLQRQTEV